MIGGVPARTLTRLAYTSATLCLAAAISAVLLNLVAPEFIDVRKGSPVALVDIAVFVAGGLAAGLAFRSLFRQANREISAGYTTLTWRSLRGSVPVVNPHTRAIERHGAPKFDPVAARAGVPWSTRSGGDALSGFSAAPSFGRAIRRARWLGVAGTCLIALALVARVQVGAVSSATVITIGVVVVALLLVVVLASAIVLRLMQTDRLSRVSRVASGIIVAAISTPDARATSERLNIAEGAIPRVAVLVFDAHGFSIWRGASAPVLTVSRLDVLALSTTTIRSGRTLTEGLEIAVIPPDERWPVLLDFTVFDPSRPVAAADKEVLTSLVDSITRVWIAQAA